MNEKELYRILCEHFRDKEFSMYDIMTHLFGDNKPRSNTPTYRKIMHSLLAIEKKGKIVSRKIQNIKYYTFPDIRKKMEEEERKRKDIEIDYEIVREMVIEGLRTGRIHCVSFNPQEKQILAYIQANIESLIQRVRPPYKQIQIKRNPLYLEINPIH